VLHQPAVVVVVVVVDLAGRSGAQAALAAANAALVVGAEPDVLAVEGTEPVGVVTP
jgi:hypothetical protein